MSSSDLEVFYGSVVIFTKKGYGFIAKENATENDPDIFVHYSDIKAEGYKILYKGQKVSYQIGQNHSGQPKAINVTVLDN